MQHYRAHFKGKSQVALVASGSTYPMTPFSPLTTAISLRRVSEVNHAAFEAASRERLREYEAQEKIAISLDAAVLDDGTLVGPDRSHFEQQLRGFVRAEDDIKMEIARLEGAELERYLSRIVASTVQERAAIHLMSQAEHYEAHLREVGLRIKSLVQAQGLDEARRFATQLPMYPRILRRVV